MDIPIDKLCKEIDNILNEFLHASYDNRQKAVQAGAEIVKEKLIAASPRDSGEFANSWEIKTKYPNNRYVGNTKTVSGKGKNISLSNILESKKPFIRPTLDHAQEEIYSVIIKELKK